MFDDDALENISLRKKKSKKYLDDEYEKAEGILSSNREIFGKSQSSSKLKFGLSVDNFLKNLNGITAKSNNITENSNKDVNYEVGMTVKHKKFGVGVIKKIEAEGDDYKLDIVFESSGFKRLMANYTPLEIVK